MDTVFFIASKLIGALLRPDTWIIIALAIVVLTLIMQRHQLALWVGGLTLIVLVTLAILPLGNVLLQPIERSYAANPPLSQVDGIIVLGGGENARASAYWGQMQFNEGGDRFTAGIALARQFPDAQLLFTGGSGALRDVAGATISEASIAGRFFLDQGIDPERLLLEGRSRNTAENTALAWHSPTPVPTRPGCWSPARSTSPARCGVSRPPDGRGS
jgi:uncharacterized SAM-binding protein YcdF (DUF218 family)